MFRVLVGKPEEKRRPRLGGRLILKRIFKKWNGGVMDWIDRRTGTGGVLV